MSHLSSQYSAARRLTLELREGVERVERIGEDNTVGTQALCRELRTKYKELEGLSGEMNRTWRVLVMQESASKRDIWKRKVEQIADECAALGQALDRHFKKEHRKQVEEQDRAELMHRLSGHDMASVMADADLEAASLESAKRSHKMIDDLMDAGVGVLGNLAEQRERLKSAQRKMLDVLNTTGLSDSLLRLIQRRQNTDQMIVYGGMGIVVVFTFLLWYWTKH